MAQPINLEDFKSSFKDIARPNRFIVTLGGGNIQSITPESLKFTCNKAQIPQLNVSGPTIKYRGTSMTLVGDVKKEPLQLTFINVVSGLAYNEKTIIRNFFEEWVRRAVEFDSVDNIRSNMDVYRFGAWLRVDQIGKTRFTNYESYKFEDVFPMEVSAIDLDMSAENSMEEFTVSFQYSRWEKL